MTYMSPIMSAPRLPIARASAWQINTSKPQTMAKPPTLQATMNILLPWRLLLLHSRWTQRLGSALMSPAMSSPSFPIAWTSPVQSNTAKPQMIFYYVCFLIAMVSQ